jgi:hypothetical protein
MRKTKTKEKHYHIVNFCLTPSADEALEKIPKGFKSLVVSKLLENWKRSGISYTDIVEHPLFPIEPSFEIKQRSGA